MPRDMAAATSAAQEPDLQVFQCETRQLLVCDIQEISLTMYLDSVRKVLGGMFRENSIEICILSRVKQITSPGWMHETSAREDPEGSGGEGGGKGDWDGEYM